MENELKLQRETDYSRLQMNQTDLNDNNDAHQSQVKSYSSSQAVWEANEGSSVNNSVKSPFFHFEWRSNILILLSKQSNSLRAVNNDAASSQTASEKNDFTVKNKGPQTELASVRTQPALRRKRLSNQRETKLNQPDVDKQLRRLHNSLVQSFSSVSDAIFGGKPIRWGTAQTHCSPAPKTEVKVDFSLSQLKRQIPRCQILLLTSKTLQFRRVNKPKTWSAVLVGGRTLLDLDLAVWKLVKNKCINCKNWDLILEETSEC